MPTRRKALAHALALSGVAAVVFLGVPLLTRVAPMPVVFLGAIAAGIPALVFVQRAWTRFLWARRIDAARLRAHVARADDPEPHVELGILASLAGAENDARGAFERAREIRPGHPQATVGLAHLIAGDGDLDRALLLFEEAARADPGLFAAHYGIGGVQVRREQFARAVHAFERALALEPEDAFTLTELSRCHLLLGDARKAQDYFARAAGQGVRDAELERLIREAAEG